MCLLDNKNAVLLYNNALDGNIYRPVNIHIQGAIYRIAGIIRGGPIFAVFTVDKHPRKLKPRIIR